MPDSKPVTVHFLNICQCEECLELRVREAEDQLAEQLYWHETEDQICCGDCPQCWHHY